MYVRAELCMYVRVRPPHAREACAGTHARTHTHTHVLHLSNMLADVDGNLQWDDSCQSNGKQYTSMIQAALAPLGLERPPTAGDVSDFGGYRDLRPQLPFLPRRRARETDR